MTFTPGVAVVPSTSVELSLCCENLRNLDVLSKSDPFCVVYFKDSPNAEYLEVGRTETLQDTLNPVWEKKIMLEYNFEKRQFLKFCVYDSDSNSRNLDDHDFLGYTESTFGEIVAAQSKGFNKNLLNGRNGKIQVTAEELTSNKEVLFLKFGGVKLDKKDFFGKSDPFIEITRVTENNTYILVHRSEVIKNTLNPTWAPFQVPIRTLSNGDDFRDLKFDIFDWNRSGSHEIIGSFHTNVHNLKQGPGQHNQYDVINQERKKKKGSKYENSGVIILESVRLETFPSFLDFIRGGTQVNFTLAVDFTGSNGNPADPRSLHYRDPSGRPNQYQAAITAVGDIVQDYDSDKMFPALGFGARVPPHGAVSHEFFLSLDPASPFCAGLEGVMAAYNNALHNVQLYGPTNFSPVIRHVAKFAHTYQNDPTNYFVLLIITDGIITDFDETKRAIIESSSLPLSIIIVGVGSEDFEAMEELDSDEALLRLGSLVAKRDIVQFVEMRKFIQKNGTWSKEQLAAEVLAEIPGQMLSFMKSKGFTPPAASAASSSFTTSPPQMAHASAPMIINP